jgi:predicted phosphodiesterase
VRIAVLADIHGNVPAFEAVIADIHSVGVDEVLVGGDLVGRGPEGRRVIERVRQLGWRSIVGNHEEYLLAFRRGEVPPEWLELEEWAASRWMAAELDTASVEWIAALPFSLQAERDPAVEVVHGSPRSTQEGIGPWLDAHQLERMVAGLSSRVLCCGHTHRAMIRPAGERLVVNVGSVGLPFDGDRRAAWALLEPTEAGWRATVRRVDWDLAELARVYETSGFRVAGGVTAELLWLEHQQARPWLVPFLSWCQASGRNPRLTELDAFRNFYHPGESLREFHRRLSELGG